MLKYTTKDDNQMLSVYLDTKINENRPFLSTSHDITYPCVIHIHAAARYELLFVRSHKCESNKRSYLILTEHI